LLPDNSNGLGPFVNGFIQNGDDTLKMDLMDERHLTLAFQAIKENNDIHTIIMDTFIKVILQISTELNIDY
jgi:predicted protein tyrosine phosphatase